MWGRTAAMPRLKGAAIRAPLTRSAAPTGVAAATCSHRLSTSAPSPSSSSKMTPEARRFQEAKRTYEAEVRAIRQRYIAEMKQKFEEEQAKKRAEEERIKEAKRKRLIAKAEERRKNLARFLEAQKEQRERFSKYLAAMQRVREAYLQGYREKQEHLIKALSEESALWITEQNIDEAITDDLFAVAGRTTFSPTRRSRDWKHMALPRVPDFSDFAEEDLFDEKEDVHFLTEKSPWRGVGALEEEGIPEGHEYYKPGPLAQDKTNEGIAAAAADGGAAAASSLASSGPNLLFEDAAYRPSWLDKIYQGAWDDFHPSQVPDEEVEHLRELAERYEEQLFAILAQKEGCGDGPGEEGQGPNKGGGGDAHAFDPRAFEDELAGKPQQREG